MIQSRSARSASRGLRRPSTGWSARTAGTSRSLTRLMKLKLSSRGPAGHQADGEIEIAGADRRQHVGIDAFEDVEADARMRALEGDDRARQQAGGNRRRGADADFADAGALDRFDVVAGVAQLRFDRLDARKQRLARRGRGDAVGTAMQQLDPEIVFQLLDALGDRRLRQIENAWPPAAPRRPRPRR